MNLIQSLVEKKLITPPRWLADNTQYLVMMGSIAYGASNDSSDVDVYGFTIPPKNTIFPHLSGEIIGFGRQTKRFSQYQQHHVIDGKKEYDVTVYGIVKYFQLMMENNPNMVDSLFVPPRCVLHATNIGQMVRERRHIFLHKGSWHKFKGYAYSQLSRIDGKNATGNRRELIVEYGFDVKFAYHLVRLLLEVEQILTEGTLTLDRNGRLLKAIRNGEWTKEMVVEFFHSKELALEDVYNSCSILPYSPDESAIKELLLDCIEEHYGTISGVVSRESRADDTINEILGVLRSGGYTA